MSAVVEIPVEDLQEFTYNHKSARAYVMGARPIPRQDPAKENYGKTDIVVDFVLREYQPDHADLMELAGTKVTLWLRPYGKPNSIRQYKEFCAALGLDKFKPDLGALENVPVIIAVKTNGDFVNVNKVTREG